MEPNNLYFIEFKFQTGFMVVVQNYLYLAITFSINLMEIFVQFQFYYY